MIDFGIIHATQRKEHTLPRTIDSLHRRGASQVTVFPDDGLLGPSRNLVRAIKRMTAGGASHICVVDDDLVFAPRMMQTLAEGMEAYPKMAFSLWTIEQNIPHDMRHQRGWVYVEPHEHLWGGSVVLPISQAFGIVDAMSALLRERPEHLLTRPDALLFLAMERKRVPLAFHLPSLADHIGLEQSTIGNDHSDGGTRGFQFDQWT